MCWSRPHGFGSVVALARPALIPAMAIGGERVEPSTMTPARFDRWYEDFRSPLRAYLRRIANNTAAADDLFQETWIRFLTHPPNTIEAAAVRAYLFTIATHLARDAWRRETLIGRWFRAPRRGEGGEEGRDQPQETVGDMAPAPDARHEAREDVARSLRRLTARERALLWLAHVEQYEHREIAAMLDIRPESVRVLLHRARRRALAALRDPEASRGGSR
jgi:RNA polymerase sigma-70 factor (ECF subfamily)